MSLRKRRLSSVLALLAATAAVGQEFRATVSGTVTDQQGAVIPGATVELKNLATNAVVSTATNESGNYVVSYLQPGAYSVTANAAGFRGSVRDRVELRIGDRLQIDFQMQVGAITEQVTVSAGAELLETTTASHGQVIDSAKVAEMPMFGRNPFLLVALAAGAQYVPTRMATSARPFDNGGMDNISINGGRAFTNEFLLDGVPDTSTESQVSNLAFVPSPDATAEFKVQANTYDAQYGRTGGGIINVGLKSGTNRLHGNVYHYFRHDKMNANRWESNLLGVRKDRVRWNQPGVQVDGPLVIPRLYNGRDRTFLMYSWEDIHTTSPWSQTFTVPTLAQLEGDFSKTVQANGSLIVIYDPLTTQQPSAGQYTRQPLPGNQVPRGRMNPVAVKSLPHFPRPNAPAGVTGFNNLIATPNVFQDIYDQHIIRIDHAFTGKHKFFSRYVRGNRHQIMGEAGFPHESSPGYLHWRTNQGGNFDLTSMFSPTLVLNSRLGYIRHQFAIAQYGEGFDPAQLGFPAELVRQLPRKFFPRYSFTDYSNVGPGRSIGSEYTFSDTWSWSETLNKVAGSHSLKLGFEGRVMFNNREQPTSSFGSFSFTKGFTQRDPIRSDAGSGNAFAAFLLGYPSSGSVPFNIASAYSNRYYVGFFQDDWRFSRKLTLNLGLRWDYESPQSERYNRQNRGFDRQSPSPLQVPGLQLKGGLLFTDAEHRLPYERDLNNFQPRIGFAYQLGRKVVMRGGYGITYSPTFDTGASYGFSQNTPFVGSVDGGITPHGVLHDPYPAGIMVPVGSARGLATLLGQGFGIGYPGRKIPYLHQFSFGFQQELPWKLLADISYVGNRARQIQTGKAINEISAEQLKLGTDLLTLLPNPFAGLLPGTGIDGATVPRQQLLRPWPQFGGITESNYPLGRMWYNALQLRVEKRLSHGVHLLGSYTVSKSLEAVGYLNNQDLLGAFARVIAANDIPQRLVISGGWQPLLFKKTRGVVKTILDGWQSDVVFSAQSGIPIGAPGGAYSSGIDPKLPAEKQTMQHFFDTCTLNVSGVRQNCISPDEPVAWIQQPPYTLRTLSTRFPNIRTRQTPRADLALFKTFALHEGLHLLFRAEAFNVANTPWFGGPNTSLGSANFGVVAPSQANDARDVQLSLKLKF